MLLTNTGGFTSHVVMVRGGSGDRANQVSGELLVRGDKLFFASEAAGSHKSKSAVVSYIWDAGRQSGFILSEALQGYAPIDSPLRYTNLTVLAPGLTQAAKSTERHTGSAQDVAIAGSDGLLTNFRVWRSANPPELPDRIEALSGTHPFTLTLARTRAVTPAASMFEPPDGFTKYTTAQSMMYELMSRQENLWHKPGELREQPIPGSVTTQPRRVAPE